MVLIHISLYHTVTKINSIRYSIPILQEQNLATVHHAISFLLI